MVSTCQKLKLLPKKSVIMWSTLKVQEQLCRSTEECTPTESNCMSDTVWGVHSLICRFSHLYYFYLLIPHV